MIRHLTALVVLGLAAALSACQMAEPGAESSATASERAQGVRVGHAPVGRLAPATYLLRRGAREALDRGAATRLRAPELEADLAADMRVCLDACGGAPWCEALCGAPEDLAHEPGFADAQRPPEDCPACGRETGFTPTPIDVEVRRDGQFVVVDWEDVPDVTDYEVFVLRQKAFDGGYERFEDLTVAGSEIRFSMLPTGFVYIFAVTPYVGGELAHELTGHSDPLSL